MPLWCLRTVIRWIDNPLVVAEVCIMTCLSPNCRYNKLFLFKSRKYTMPSYSISYNHSISTPTRGWISAIVPRLVLLQNLGQFCQLGRNSGKRTGLLVRAQPYPFPQFNKRMEISNDPTVNIHSTNMGQHSIPLRIRQNDLSTILNR